MKIPIDRETKIALLQSLKQGYIDTVQIPGVMKVISKNYNAFLDLMQQAALKDDEGDEKY